MPSRQADLYRDGGRMRERKTRWGGDRAAAGPRGQLPQLLGREDDGRCDAHRTESGSPNVSLPLRVTDQLVRNRQDRGGPRPAPPPQRGRGGPGPPPPPPGEPPRATTAAAARGRRPG